MRFMTPARAVRPRRLALLAGVALLVLPAMAFAGSGPGANPDSATMIQAEAQQALAHATQQAAAALDRMDQGPVDPQKVATPKGVHIAAPAAPVADPAPKIDLAKLPPALRRPVTISWHGSVQGALKTIARRIDYRYVPPATAPATPRMIVLHEKAKPAALLLREIGSRVAQYGKVVVDPNHRTIGLVITPAAEG